VVVAVDLPEHLPIAAEEIALLRAFLAPEINEILRPTPAASVANQPATKSPAAAAEDGPAPAGACLCP